MCLIFLSFFRYLQHQATEEGNKPKEERRHRMDGCHLVMTCCFKQAFLILVNTFFETKSNERRHLGLTKSEGICKRFDYTPNRIESTKI